MNEDPARKEFTEMQENCFLLNYSMYDHKSNAEITYKQHYWSVSPFLFIHDKFVTKNSWTEQSVSSSSS